MKEREYLRIYLSNDCIKGLKKSSIQVHYAVSCKTYPIKEYDEVLTHTAEYIDIEERKIIQSTFLVELYSENNKLDEVFFNESNKSINKYGRI